VHFDQDSLYIAVQSVVDGAVAVAAYRDSAPAGEIEGLIEAFPELSIRSLVGLESMIPTTGRF